MLLRPTRNDSRLRMFNDESVRRRRYAEDLRSKTKEISIYKKVNIIYS